MNRDGFRQPKEGSSKQKLKELEVVAKNLQQGFNIQKVVAQQFAKSIGKLDNDVNNSMSVLNDIQYRTLAMLEVLCDVAKVDKEKVESIADGLKVKDYNEASDKEDLQKGYELDDSIKEDSIVILASECKTNPEASIFRTKFDITGDLLMPDVRAKLVGLKVGDKVDVTLPDKNEHTLEVIGVRKKKAPLEEVVTESK